MGSEVCKATLNSLNNAVFDSELNSTLIALIPKKRNPSCITEFCPISLYNVLYKIISKVLANRLKRILPHIISPSQSAFIPRRLITDNVLAAYETLHMMHSQIGGKNGYMAIKIDMSKAYDRVEWDFLEVVMRKMGFGSQWIKLVMMCVTMVKYVVLVNGVPMRRIFLTQSIRQGDPISPYLFILCAVVLSSQPSKADREGRLQGVLTSMRGPCLNHLLFTDDSLLFCRANREHWNKLSNILQRYGSASRQMLNTSKTAIFFSRNTPPELKDEVIEVAAIPSTQRYDTYLGLPALVGKSHTK